MHKKIIHHFKKNDPILYSVLLKNSSISELELSRSNNYFRSLCREIIGQQLASKAAHKIFERFLNLFPGKKVTAEYALTIPNQQIRDVGPAWSKVRFIKGLAQKIVTKEIDLKKLDKLENELVSQELRKIKGIGPWTTEMFLMFAMGREDVFSHGDYGLRKAIKQLYRFKKEPTRKQIETIVEKWSPYKTYACLILWESLDNV
jgi:DNA-3-methyladenine glycosylase II